MFELPKYISEWPLDKFYTKECIAKDLIVKVLSKIDTSNYTFLEPSAGDGAFFNNLPNPKIGIDIEPENSKILKMDFSEFIPENKKYICIGNPPFAKKGILALKFMLKAKDFCDYVCFILPMNFDSIGKGCPRNTIDKYYEFIYSETLPKDSFIGKSVNCVFQIWKNRYAVVNPPTKSNNSEYIDIYSVDTHIARKCGMKRINEYDYFIDNMFYSKITLNKELDSGRHFCGYGIIIKKDKEKISKLLEDTDWTKYSRLATNNCHHITMTNIKQVIKDVGL